MSCYIFVGSDSAVDTTLLLIILESSHGTLVRVLSGYQYVIMLDHYTWLTRDVIPPGIEIGIKTAKGAKHENV